MRGLRIPAAENALVMSLGQDEVLSSNEKTVDPHDYNICILNCAKTFLTFYDFIKLKGRDQELTNLINFVSPGLKTISSNTYKSSPASPS